ncbi:hypothetical protein QF032_003270 [Streptomyces achromogenes]|nr:hypothetical protein [Streptomyces achromogenes]
MWEVVGDGVLLVAGVLIVCTGCWSWRWPERVRGLMAGAPVWLMRCSAVGFVLTGCAVGAFGGFDLADRRSEWLVGPLRAGGVLLVVFSMVGAVALRQRKHDAS